MHECKSLHFTGRLDPVAQQTTTIHKQTESQTLIEFLQISCRLDLVAQQTTTIHKRTESQTLGEFLQFIFRLDPAAQQLLQFTSELTFRRLENLRFTFIFILYKPKKRVLNKQCEPN
jgi:hypothetical protein